MLKEDFGQKLVWAKNDQRKSGEPPKEQAKDDEKKPKSASERQAEQTVRDEDKEWKRCYAKAKDNPEARRIVALVAKNTANPVVLRAIPLAVDHPESVFTGEKVRALRGVRGAIVRWLIGAVDTGGNA